MTNEEAIKILTRIMNNNFYGGEVQTACKMAIEALSQPSLPNLDEAADAYTDSQQGDYPFSEGMDNFCYGDIHRAFKAGAEWMAGQGETCEFEVYLDSLETPDGTLYEYPACYMRLPGGVAGTYCVPEKEYKEGDNVVVQIRKK